MTVKTFNNQTVAGLTLVQFATDVQDTFPYLTSARALGQRLVEVREVSEQGNVNQLFVENPSDVFVFFMDGDILAGAKQNRVLNTSVLLAPRSKTLVPVSCVERGRWHSVSAQFSYANHSAPSSLRALKSTSFSRKQNANFMADQGGVWEQVAMLKTSAGAHAPTDSLSDVFAHKQNEFNAVLENLRHAAGANGLAVFYGDRVICLDVFNRVEALADYLPRLVRGVLLDTANLPLPKMVVLPEQLIMRLDNLIAGAALQDSAPFPGVGVGHEHRFETADNVGCELRFERQPIHLSILSKAPAQA